MPQSVCLSGVCPPKFMRLPKFLGSLRRFIETLINKPMRSAEKLINRVLGKTLSITLLWWIPFFIIRYQLPYISGRFTDQSADQLWRPSSHFTLVNFDCVCNKFSMRKNFMCSKFFKNLFAHTHKHIHSQSNQVSQSPDHFSLLFIAWPYLAIEKSKILCANYFFYVFTPLKWIYFRNVFILNQTFPLSLTSFSGWFAQKSPVLFNKNFLLVNNNILM